MNTNTGISVVICCHNGSERLPATLAHLIRQEVQHEDTPWEVIVVDNDSSDGTSQVAKSCWPSDAPVPLRVVSEPRLGVTYARQRGFIEARYDLVCLVDDDNWLAPNYIQTALELMQQHPEVGACGGRLEAVCEVEPPIWFEEFKGRYAVGEQAPDSGDLTWSKGYLWGAGLIIRRAAWEELNQNGHQPLLSDRAGTSLASGGDTEICYALRLAGWRLWYDQRLTLKHYIPASRLTWEYLRRLYRGNGAAAPFLRLYRSQKTSGQVSRHNRPQLRWIYRLALAGYGLAKSYIRTSVLGPAKGQGNPSELDLQYRMGELTALIHSRREYHRAAQRIRIAP